MTIARDLAKLVNGTAYKDLPAQTVDHAAMLIASTVGSAGLGYGLDSSRIVRELVRQRGGTPESTVWFEGAKLPVSDVARVNALMSDASASDDSDLRNIV